MPFSGTPCYFPCHKLTWPEKELIFFLTSHFSILKIMFSLCYQKQDQRTFSCELTLPLNLATHLALMLLSTWKRWDSEVVALIPWESLRPTVVLWQYLLTPWQAVMDLLLWEWDKAKILPTFLWPRQPHLVMADSHFWLYENHLSSLQSSSPFLSYQIIHSKIFSGFSLYSLVI